MPTTQQKNDFINKIAPIIQKYAKQYGYYNCSGTIAQACCESNYGVSSLSAKYNNFFGLKCGSSWKGRSVNLATKEDYGAGLVGIKDNFRVYDSMEDGVKGYYEFINTKRYANLKDPKIDTPEEFLSTIKSDGYATAKDYVDTCMKFVKQHDLTRFDNPNYVAPIVTNTSTEKTANTVNVAKINGELPTLKLGSNDAVLGYNYVASWQTYLKTLNFYNGAINGVFDATTHFSVRAYQSAYNQLNPNAHLVVDGIVGKKTWATVPNLEG